MARVLVGSGKNMFTYDQRFSRSSRPDLNERIEAGMINTSASLIAGITAAVGSKLFWAYGTMLLKLASVLAWISAWVGGCPCHENTVQEYVASQFMLVDETDDARHGESASLPTVA
jgi:hypothetical protein